MDVTFITGNAGKAEFLGKHLGVALKHQKIELDEIQSLSLEEVALHKARQAYQLIQSPVLVDDNGLSFNEWGRLPGPFIKWFLEERGNAGICRLLDDVGRAALASVSLVYFDGATVQVFNGQKRGTIAAEPRGTNGYGWDPIFIPEGSVKTYSEMDDDELERTSLRVTTVFPQLRAFLQNLDK